MLSGVGSIRFSLSTPRLCSPGYARSPTTPPTRLGRFIDFSVSSRCRLQLVVVGELHRDRHASARGRCRLRIAVASESVWTTNGSRSKRRSRLIRWSAGRSAAGGRAHSGMAGCAGELYRYRGTAWRVRDRGRPGGSLPSVCGITMAATRCGVPDNGKERVWFCGKKNTRMPMCLRAVAQWGGSWVCGTGIILRSLPYVHIERSSGETQRVRVVVAAGTESAHFVGICALLWQSGSSGALNDAAVVGDRRYRGGTSTGGGCRHAARPSR